MLKIDKNFVQRLLFGALLVGTLVGAILWHELSFLFVFGLISALTTQEFHNITNDSKHKAIEVLPSLASIVLFMSTFSENRWDIIPEISLAVYGIMLIGVFIVELYRKQENPLENYANVALGQMYVALPFAVLPYIYNVEPSMVLALFVCIWANDTCAYLFGCIYGRHRLFERISPKKSWEGFVGGLLGSVAAACVFSLFVDVIGMWKWIGFGIIVTIFGTFGDLIESILKRTLGVKDSGTSIPGHGGWLDRFDSMLLAVPAVMIYLSIVMREW